MASEKNGSRTSLRKIIFKASKASVKAVVFYMVYYVCWLFLTPVASMIPALQQSIQTFVVVYITLIIVGELSSGTVYQHFFGVANALFVIAYLIFSLNSATVSVTYQGVVLMVDLRLFLVIAMLLGLLGLGKSVLQAINFASKKAEQTPI
jgi:fatty acid desaturase